MNKYELIARSSTPKGIFSTRYYFNKEKDAELYRLYLLQKEGERQINAVIKSERTHNWERREYQEFKESIDWNELPAKVKNIKFISETDFVEMRGKK